MRLIRLAPGTTMTMGWILFDDLVLSAGFVSISVSPFSLSRPYPLKPSISCLDTVFSCQRTRATQIKGEREQEKERSTFRPIYVSGRAEPTTQNPEPKTLYFRATL